MSRYIVRLCSTEYLTFQDGFWSYCIDRETATRFASKRAAQRALSNHRKRSHDSFPCATIIEVQDG